MNHPDKETVITADHMASAIDHTLLKTDALRTDIEKVCREAIQHHFGAVCVNSCHVPLVSVLLAGSDTQVCAVVGFPLGAMHTKAKAFEARMAVEARAGELDMVINVGALKSGDAKTVAADIRAVRQAAGKNILKVIIETCLLSKAEKVLACELAKSAGADFVKTSTGFSSGGATIADVQLMKATVGDGMQVKASGGIKDWVKAVAMLKAGASRIGTSSGVAILEQAPK